MKKILCILLLCLAQTFGFAQEGMKPGDTGKKEQKIKALYVAYVTQKLNLSESEAQKFWPVHAQFDAELKQVSLDIPELERQQAILNVKKKYQDRFSGVLGTARTNDFYRLDGEFRKKLVEEMRKRRQENNGGRNRNNRNF